MKAMRIPCRALPGLSLETHHFRPTHLGTLLEALLQTLLSKKRMGLCLMLLGGFPAQAQDGDHTKDYQVTVTAMETEEFSLNLELWSPQFIKEGYFKLARFGAVLGTHNYYEIDGNNKKRHVNSNDIALGYQIGIDGGWLRLRSAFLGGLAKLDRHSVAGPDGPGGGNRDPSQYSFFETRHGFQLVPPTHIASKTSGPLASNEVSTPQDSLFELGIGFRWNFIGSEKTYRAGDILIREIQVFPYLAAHIFI